MVLPNEEIWLGNPPTPDHEPDRDQIIEKMDSLEARSGYATRDAASAASLAAQPAGSIVTLAGLKYITDPAATGTASATYDLGVDGLRPYGEIIDLAQFGVTLDGTNETATVQRAFDAADAFGVSITCGSGTLKCGTINVGAGVRDIDLSAAEWVGDVALTAAPRLNVTAAPAISGRRYDVRMNMANGDLIGIEGLLVDSHFGGVEIYGYTNHALLNHIGIRPDAGSTNCDFRGYKWTGYDTPTQRGIGIHCTGTVAAYGGYFPSGALARATVPVTNMRINGATFINGSYAWVANGTEFSTFAGNYCEGQNHRCIQLTAGCYRCAASGNMFKNFKSTAILFCYGSTECSSFNDTVDVQTYLGGEAAFNINTGAVGTMVMGAKGFAAMNFFAYVATGADGTVIDGCVGEGFYIGGVILQSDWADPTDPNRSALYFDRSNYGPPSDLDPTFTKWSFADLDRVIVRNCSMGNGYTGRSTYAFGAIQMDSADGASVYSMSATFQGNKVHDTAQVAYDFAVWKESGTCRVRLIGNDFRNGYKAAYAGAVVKWFDFVERWSDNGPLDQLIIAEGILLDGATPSVATPAPNSVPQVFTFAHTVATDVTNFLDGFNGQVIRIWGSTNATIKYNSGLIRTSTAADVTMNSNQLIEFTRRGGIWFETGRSF